MTTTTAVRTVAVARLEPSAREQAVLTLERDAALEAGHTRPGQYCQLSVPSASIEGHFVLIDPPGAGALRFLLRAGGPAADALRALPVAAPIGVRGPLGDGFPVEHAVGRDVLLVSAGAGIAAIRPLLLSLLPHTARRVWLYHGTRTLAHVPFTRDLEHAQKQGAHVTITVSQLPGASELTGRVQHAIERDKPELVNAVAFVSGMQAMVDAVRVVMPKLGLPAERIYLNY
jgi:sulfhydrogenase subunit gamma (sulfur reductase)